MKIVTAGLLGYENIKLGAEKSGKGIQVSTVVLQRGRW